MPDGFIGGGDLLRPDLRILVRRNGGSRPIGPCAVSGNFRTDQGPSGQILFRTGLNGLCPGTVLGFGFQNLLPRDLLRGPSVRYRGKHLRSGSPRSAVGIVGYGNGIDGFGENDVGFIGLAGGCRIGNKLAGTVLGLCSAIIPTEPHCTVNSGVVLAGSIPILRSIPTGGKIRGMSSIIGK